MFLFYIKEVLRSIKKARLPFLLSLTTTSISVILIIISVIVLGLSRNFETSVKDKLTFHLFLKESLSSDSIEQLKEKLNSFSYVNTVKYLDKNDAAESFIKETGEDFRSVIEFNPLPASIEIKFKPDFIERDSILNIANRLSTLDGVDEVVFQGEAMFKLLKLLASIRIYIIMVSVILAFIALYIVYSTDRLIIHSGMNEINTMKLVGARLSSISIPVLLNGFTIGILASVISLAVIKLFIILSLKYLNTDINPYDSITYVIALLSGPVIGLLGSLLSVRKITLRIS